MVAKSNNVPMHAQVMELVTPRHSLAHAMIFGLVLLAALVTIF